MPTLAFSFYWSAMSLLIASGVLLALATLLRWRRRWWLKLPLALMLIFGPYLIDVVPARISAVKESASSALVPTTVLLWAMQPDTGWPYGLVFDRLHKSADRHAMWGWQLDMLAEWCRQRVLSEDVAMATRGVQIAGTLANRGCDDAITALGEALHHSDGNVALLACEVLQSLGERKELVTPLIKAAAEKSRNPEVRRRAEKML